MPPTTKAALIALWIAAAIYFVFSLAYGFLWKATIVRSPSLAITVFGPLALIIFFLYMTGKRRNWARFALMIMILINLSQLSPTGILGLFQTIPALALAKLALALIPGFAAAILFTRESNNWFGVRAAPENPNAAG